MDKTLGKSSWSGGAADVTVTTRRPMRCPAGFDYEAVTDSCSLSTGLGGGDTTPGGSEGSGSSGGGDGDGGDGEEGGPRTVEFTLSWG